MNNLTFQQLSTANLARIPQFKNKLGELSHPEDQGGINNWSPAEWSNAMAGEAGEACNLTKKLLRGDYDNDLVRAQHEIGCELADVVIYADLCAQRLGINLGAYVTHKFNLVSDRVGSNIKLPL